MRPCASTANGGVEVCPPLPYNQRVSDVHSTPIDATTRYCAVYGRPVQHSASPPMQNAGMAALGLNWRYLACEVRPRNWHRRLPEPRPCGSSD